MKFREGSFDLLDSTRAVRSIPRTVYSVIEWHFDMPFGNININNFNDYLRYM